jgi:AraC family transcriptional regulator
MSLAAKAIFIVERNLALNLSLGWLAERCNVSRFHLVRAFGEATGFSLMEYVRARRLTIAAQALASGAEDILTLALDHCYASHEAFSRAFKSQFDKTPEDVRKARSTVGLPLVAAINLLEDKKMKLEEPRLEQVGELLFVGLKQHVPLQEMQKIAGQWQRFMTEMYGDISDKLSEPPVGVTIGMDYDGIEYVCATGVRVFGKVPKECSTLTIAPAKYAVFAHDGHVTEIRNTYESIWNVWFPKSGIHPAEAPGFERHNVTFDPRTGSGGVTIWIPIRSA